jgi:tetratricopeptide (TPR) repeat protein
LGERSSAAGEQLYQQVLQRLDRYVEDWSTGRRSLCTAEAADQLDASERELAVNCFDERRRRFEALLGVLQGDTEPTIWQAADAVDELPPLESCTDTAWLRASVKPPDDPDLRLRALEVESQLGEARSLLRSGAITEALDAARASLAAARVLDHAPLYVDSLLVYGRSQAAAGHYKEASRALEEAYFGAVQAGDDVSAADAAIALVRVNANALRDVTAARAWVDHAKTALDRSTVEPVLRSELDLARCGLHEEEGKYELAFELCKRAYAEAKELEDPRMMAASLNGMAWLDSRLGRDREAADRFAELEELVKSSAGADHPNRAAVISNRATVLLKMGRYAEARSAYEEALELSERVLGPDHVSVADLLSRLAQVSIIEGEPSRARPLLDRAMAIHRRNGSDEWATGPVTQLEGLAAFSDGDYDTAKQLYRRVLAERERRLAPDHREITSVLVDLGRALSRAGEHEGAIAALDRALDGLSVGEVNPEAEGYVLLGLAQAHHEAEHFELALEKAAMAQGRLEPILGNDHPTLADVAVVRAETLRDLGKLEDAATTLQSAVKTRADTLGENHPKTVDALLELADVDVQLDRVAEAQSNARRAVDAAGHREHDLDRLARARFALARALARDAAQRPQARELASMALAHYVESGDKPERRTEIERWLRHPR